MLVIIKIGEVRIDGDEVTSIDIDDHYVVLGFGFYDRSKGKLEVWKRDTLEKVHEVIGDPANYNLGKNVQISSERLQPGNIEVHYVYYNSVRRASSSLNRFYIGLLAIIHEEVDGQVQLRVVNTVDNYELQEQQFANRIQERERKSTYTTFVFGQGRLIMKQEQDR